MKKMIPDGLAALISLGAVVASVEEFLRRRLRARHLSRRVRRAARRRRSPRRRRAPARRHRPLRKLYFDFSPTGRPPVGPLSHHAYSIEGEKKE